MDEETQQGLKLAEMIPYVGSAVQLGTSLYQMYQGNKLGKTEQPKFEIPESVQKALKNSQMLASQKELAGQSRIEDKLRGNTAQTMSAVNRMGGGAAGMGAALQAYGNEQNQLSDIAIQADQNWANRQTQYQNALNAMGSWEDKKNQWETRDPFTATMENAANLKNSGVQNLFGAVTSAAQTYEGGNNIDSYETEAEKQRKRLAGLYV